MKFNFLKIDKKLNNFLNINFYLYFLQKMEDYNFLSSEPRESLIKNYNLLCHLICNEDMNSLEKIKEIILKGVFCPSKYWTTDDYDFQENLHKKISWLIGFLGKWEIFLEFYNDLFDYNMFYIYACYDNMNSLGEFYWKNEMVFFALSGSIIKNQISFFYSLLEHFEIKDEFEPLFHFPTFYKLIYDHDIMKNAIQKCSKEMMSHLFFCENSDLKKIILSMVSKINQEHNETSLFQLMAICVL